MAASISVETRLGDYIARPARLPEAVAEKTRHHLLDTLAAMISGAHLKPGRMALAYVEDQGGRPEATVAGSMLVTSAVNAALANGMLAHADETDDSHAPSITHPGCTVVPAALAMAERHRASGVDLLEAVALGYDVGTRLTMAMDPERLFQFGHSTHALGGLFGAAAAAGRLAGLDARACRWLLSYTAQQASGLSCWQRDPDHVEKAFDFGGMPARNAVAAATMVASGMTGVEDALTGVRGLFPVLGGEPERLVEGLGERFEILATNIKRWSVGSPIQAALDSVEALLPEVQAEAIEAVTVSLPDNAAHVVDNRAMPDVCLQHLVAVMLLDRGLSFAMSHDYARMADPAVMALRAKVTLVHSRELTLARPARQGIVALRLKDGRELQHRTQAVRGTADNPMTRAEVEAKAFDLIQPVTGEERARALVEAVGTIERLSDVTQLRPLLQA